MSPGQTGHITGHMGRVPGTDGTHTTGCPAKILYVYWFFSFPIHIHISTSLSKCDIVLCALLSSAHFLPDTGHHLRKVHDTG